MISVDIYVPSLDQKYDFHLDENTKIRVIIEEIIEMVEQKECTVLSGNTKALLLCDHLRHLALPKDETLCNCGIFNGSSLLLV